MIACVLRQFPKGVIEVLHVKGHQDSNRPTPTLPWPAQLNVIADKAANNYIQQHRHEPSLNTPFLPSAQIHLRDSRHQIVIKRWNFHLRSEFSQKPYEAWLSRQFHWPRPTIATIDFQGLSTALRCFPSPLYRFTTKWINQSLPTRRRVHRYDQHIPPTCKNCPLTTECDTHLLTCPSDPRRSACAELYTSLRTRLIQLHTQPAIRDTILHLVCLALDLPSCPPPTIADLLSQQQLIGQPILFLKGRWSKTFRIQQEQFYCTQHRPITFSGDRWMRHILTLLFEQLHSLWHCRNAQTHGADQELQDKIKREQLTIRVTALYNQLPNLLVHDRQAFESLTQDDLLSGPTSSISTWLRIAEPTIQRCLRDSQIKLHSNQRDIRDFFDEASYVDSDASDTTLSFDTLAFSKTISFHTHSASTSISSNSSISSSDSSGTHYSGLDGSSYSSLAS